MIKDIVNSGNYDIISASLTPSLSLAGGKLNMQAKLYYAHEMHSGIRNFSLKNYGLYPYVSYNMNKNFSVSAGYGKISTRDLCAADTARRRNSAITLR